MTNEELSKISNALFNCFRNNIKDFIDNFSNELDSNEMSSKDIYLMLSNAIINLTNLIFHLKLCENVSDLKEDFMMKLTSALFKEEFDLDDAKCHLPLNEKLN